MSPVQTTVLAKTDIVGYTPRVSTLSDRELSVLLSEHKNLISEIVEHHEGIIVKGEGDSFWIIFRSVTAAALAALAMHDKLRVVQVGRGEEKCLAIRVAIAVGDVLHQENDIFGHAVNLLARIESVTPANETYLSQAAWLILNKAEIPTAYVDIYALKGIQEPEKVYKVEQKYRTRMIPNQIIVYFDIRGYGSFMESHLLPRLRMYWVIMMTCSFPFAESKVVLSEM